MVFFEAEDLTIQIPFFTYAGLNQAFVTCS